jgi:hypothetical protein
MKRLAIEPAFSIESTFRKRELSECGRVSGLSNLAVGFNHGQDDKRVCVASATLEFVRWCSSVADATRFTKRRLPWVETHR